MDRLRRPTGGNTRHCRNPTRIETKGKRTWRPTISMLASVSYTATVVSISSSVILAGFSALDLVRYFRLKFYKVNVQPHSSSITPTKLILIHLSLKPTPLNANGGSQTLHRIVKPGLITASDRLFTASHTFFHRPLERYHKLRSQHWRTVDIEWIDCSLNKLN